MAHNKPAPPWNKPLRQYIINQLARWKSYADIWRTVSDSGFCKETGIAGLDPAVYTYDGFRMRCKRVAKNDIALAHESYQKELGTIKWGDDKKRLQGISDLIDKMNMTIDAENFDNTTTGTMAQLVGQLRQLYEQARKEVQADADRAALSASGTRVLLTNPKNVELDVDHVTELMMVYREEIGGLHKLDLDALSTKELELLRDKCVSVITHRENEINDVDYEIEDNNDN